MEIKVYSNLDSYSNRKALYVRRIEVAKGLEVDFGMLTRCMRLLYGNSCIIEFLVVS